MKQYKLSASLICANPLFLENDVHDLISANIDRIHFDVMDGTFVPRYGLFPEVLSSVRALTNIPVDVHMMTEDPSRYVDVFSKVGATSFYVHPETCKHIHYALKNIKEHGMKSGVVLNYGTPLCILDYILEEVDMIMLMAINPGIVGHPFIPGILNKISDVQKKIEKSEIKYFIKSLIQDYLKLLKVKKKIKQNYYLSL